MAKKENKPLNEEYKIMKELYGHLTYNGTKVCVPEFLESVNGLEPINLNYFPVVNHICECLDWVSGWQSGYMDVDGNIFERGECTRLVDLPENKRPEKEDKKEDSYNGVYLTVDKNGTEGVWAERPEKTKNGVWNIKDPKFNDSFIILPKGTIKKIIGKDLFYKDSAYFYNGK